MDQPRSVTASLSPSRAGDFMTCPLLYRFRVIDRLPEPPSQAATRGTVVHAVLERLFDLPASERTVEQANDLVSSAWQQLLAEDEQLAEFFADDDGELAIEWLDGTEALLNTYFQLEDPTRLEPAEREFGVEVDLASGLRLRGYIDRLDVAPNGAMRVVDYKTGRAPSEMFQQRALFQMRFYALALWRLRGEVPAMLQLVYLGNGEVVRYEPDETDLLAMERKVGALWEAIARAHQSGDWRPNKSKLCDWCHHKPLCPAWGGKPPPLPPQADPSSTSDDRPAATENPLDV
ncbi:MAG TPA: PD-(D/E)XK nuclease family protein [Actinomycetes bacterium]|nr:PD-(D/E)XK nuclease family protein [Actinomycetes bacterium]